MAETANNVTKQREIVEKIIATDIKNLTRDVIKQVRNSNKNIFAWFEDMLSYVHMLD